MGSDPYINLAEILEGTLSLVDYYARRMPDTPANIESTKAAIGQLIAELHVRSVDQSAAD